MFSTVAPLLAHMFMDMVEGLPNTWTMHMIVPIHMSGNPIQPGHYCTITIGDTINELYETLLEA